MRLILAFVMGPLPILGLAIASQQGVLDPYQMEIYAAGVFAYWGLFIGVLQRSLFRSMLGLNLGAAIGYAWGYYMSHASFNSTGAQTFCAAASFACAGAALSWICAQNSERPIWSMVKGMLGGAFAFSLVAVLTLILATYNTSGILGMALVTLIPFWVGHFIFITFAVNRRKPVAA